MDKSIVLKFGFLVVVAISIIVIFVMGFINKDEPVEDVFETGETETDDERSYELEVDIDDLEDIDEEVEDEVIEPEEEVDEASDEELDENVSDVDDETLDESISFENEKLERNKFGDNQIDEAFQVVEDFTTMFIEVSSIKKEDWLMLSTEEVTENVLENLVLSQEGIEIEIEDLDVYIIPSEKANEVMFEVIVTWFEANDLEILSEHEKVFFISTIMEEEIKVNSFVEFS